MRKLWAFLIVLLLSACQTNNPLPEGIMSEDRFVELLTDIEIMETTFLQKVQRVDNVQLQIAGAYSDLFIQYNISAKTFEDSYNYWIEHPDDMMRILEKVQSRLQLMEQQLSDT